MFIEALAKGALKAGINKKQALNIAAYAVLGSAKMFIESDLHPGELIDRVCSPGGTTIEGVCTLDEYKFTSGIVKAVENSIEKDKALN
jgi:pyrroline-5-carboxylate reductase